MQKDILLGIYKHYKGLLVQVIAVGRNTETEERMVVYIPLNGKLDERSGPMVSIRPIENFLGDVTVEGNTVKRFEYVGHTLN